MADEKISSPGKGSYLLIMTLIRGEEIAIGKLGRFDFSPGSYCYTGSAFGPGGLVARINRHLLPTKNNRWHIDYLRQQADDIHAWYEVGADTECDWSNSLAEKGTQPVRGFGSSDCHCNSHLTRFPNTYQPDKFVREMKLATFNHIEPHQTSSHRTTSN